jgi:hypothetical protein
VQLSDTHRKFPEKVRPEHLATEISGPWKWDRNTNTKTGHNFSNHTLNLMNLGLFWR